MEYKLNYDISRDDYFKFNKAHIKKSKLFFLIAIQAFIYSLLIWIIASQIYAKKFSVMTVFFILMLIYILIGRRIFRKRSVNKIYDSNESLHKQIEITIDENSINEKNAVSVTSMTKDKITEIIADENGIYIYYSKLQAFLIPFHAFENAEKFNEFIEFVKLNYSDKSVKFKQFSKHNVLQTVLAITVGCSLSFFYIFVLLKF